MSFNLFFNALVIAGGFGTRMSKEFPNIPKPLIPVMGTPILFHNIDQCLKHGFNKVLVSTHFQPSKIEEAIRSKYGTTGEIQCIVEEKPLGTAGALQLTSKQMADDYLVLYADVYSDVDLQKLYDYHLRVSSNFTAVVHPNNHPFDSDIFDVDPTTERVTSVYPHRLRTKDDVLPNMVNAALYVVNRDSVPNGLKKWDIAQELIPAMLEAQKPVYAYETVEYLKDMGSPKRLLEVQDDIRSGKVQARSQNKVKRAIFLDRDGVINSHVGYVTSAAQLQLESGAAESIRNINQSHYLCLCVTNQPVVARGDVTLSELRTIHNKVATDLGLKGAYLDGLSFCPHHPEKGFKGEIASLKVECNCRKPREGMLTAFASKLNIDLGSSWVIGDTSRDILAGCKVGARTVLLMSGDDNKGDFEGNLPTAVGRNLKDATNFILKDFDRYQETVNQVLDVISKTSCRFNFFSDEIETWFTFSQILKRTISCDFGTAKLIIRCDNTEDNFYKVLNQTNKLDNEDTQVQLSIELGTQENISDKNILVGRADGHPKILFNPSYFTKSSFINLNCFGFHEAQIDVATSCYDIEIYL